MKRTVVSFILSILFNAIGLVLNLVYYNSSKRLLVGFSSDGGSIQRGFGWISEHSGFVADGESYIMNSLTFSFGNLLLFIVAGLIVFYLVLLITGAFKTKR